MSHKSIKKELVRWYSLGLDSLHGPRHWERVEAYGLYLVKHNGGSHKVVELFAWFHDCQRVNENTDPGHGLRGAKKAREMRERLGLDDDALETLYQACAGHTDLKYSHDPTIAACWDADRLDLDRVGIEPDPSYFSTPEGKRLALLPAVSRRMEVGITVNLGALRGAQAPQDP